MDVDGNVLMKMHKSRNELTHLYEEEKAIEFLKQVKKTYLTHLLKVDSFFEGLILEWKS